MVMMLFMRTSSRRRISQASSPRPLVPPSFPPLQVPSGS